MHTQTSKWVYIVGFIILGLYSIYLVAMEILVSQAFVRNYFTDIWEGVRFYAINTTLSVTFLWFTALLFVISAVCIRESTVNRKLYYFYLSQVIIFAYLGFDDRFLVHETLTDKFNINDGLFLVGIGMIEILLLLSVRKQLSSKMIWLLMIAAFFFGVMTLIDQFVPREAVPRLSLEDLSKTWANVFIFLFAWETCMQNIRQLKQSAMWPNKNLANS
ncbi:MAG: hypothetical protein GY796_20765 [Chloroflexi bacterium]|nr:hypothetical protein [Chloroflexota bacterium]